LSQREQYDLLVFTIFEVLAVLLATHFNGQPLLWIMEPTSSAGALKSWFEECEGYYKDYYSSTSRETSGLNVDIPVTTESTPASRTAVY